MFRSVFVAAGVFFLTAGLCSAQPKDVDARAELRNPQGEVVGTVHFSKAEKGVDVMADITQLPAGEHAFHIHEKGACEAPDFKSAGGHYNPTGAQHGFLNSKGPHAGDLPNITVQEDGTARYQWTTDLVSLDPDAENTLFSEDGTAIVIHIDPDDYITDPAGGGGDRIACGVIEKPGN